MRQEKWNALKPEAHADLAKLVEEWETRNREEFLGQLLIEERRAIETGEATDGS